MLKNCFLAMLLDSSEPNGLQLIDTGNPDLVVR
jgi:hypothetical protein